MKLTLKCTILALVILLFGAGVSHALPSSYGSATHSTRNWQELATPTSSTGVFWSINGGAWGQDVQLIIGDTIQFQVNMHKRNVGTHHADHVKTWVDWGQDGWFDEVDAVVSDRQILPALQGSSLKPAPGEADFSFLSGLYAITKDMVGDLYLRARVVCSSSLNKAAGHRRAHNAPADNIDFMPVGHLYQGEVEEWALNVATPIPPSFLLLGSGLLGLVAVRRKSFQK